MVPVPVTFLLAILANLSVVYTLTDKEVEEKMIDFVLDWSKVNLKSEQTGIEFPFDPLDLEHEAVAEAVALTLVTKQKRPEDKTVRFVEANPFFLLIFPTIKTDENADLGEAEVAYKRGLDEVKTDLTKMLSKTILGHNVVAWHRERKLKMCAVFVAANEFLFTQQKNLLWNNETIPESSDAGKSCCGFAIRKYIESDLMKTDFNDENRIPLSSVAILEAINYSELQHKRKPILKKLFQIQNRTIIFEGELDKNNAVVQPKKKCEDPNALKLKTFICLGCDRESYGVILCEDGSLYIVGSCSDPKERFQASFGKQAEIQAAPVTTLENSPDVTIPQHGKGKAKSVHKDILDVNETFRLKQERKRTQKREKRKTESDEDEDNATVRECNTY